MLTDFLTHFLNVDSRGKSLVAAFNDNCPDVVVIFPGFYLIGNFVQHDQIDGVEDIRAIEGDYSDVAPGFD